MYTNLLFCSLAVAGLTMIWKKILKDTPVITGWIQTRPRLLSTLLRCSFCCTYWTSLLAVIVLDPLRAWVLPLRWSLPPTGTQALHLLVSWMIVGTTAWVLRGIAEELRQFIHYHNHVLRKTSGHE